MAALLKVTVGACGAELEGEPYVSVTCGGFSASTAAAPGEEAQTVELLVDLATPLPLAVQILDRASGDAVLASATVDLTGVVPLWEGTAVAGAALAEVEGADLKAAVLTGVEGELSMSVAYGGEKPSALLPAPSGFGWLSDPTKFETLWRDRDQLLEEFFELAKAQSAAFDTELAACTLIQRVWRGTSCRLRLFERSYAVLTIQRIARGFSGRLEYAQRLVVAQRLARMAYYDGQATCIQKRWRGFWSRKTRHDFYARQLFLQAIQSKNEEMRNTLSQHYEQQVEDTRQRTFEAARNDFERLISDKHHLVSTVGIPGVFNSPFPGMQPTAFGDYVDDHLRRTVDGLTQRTLPTMNSSRRVTQGKLSPGSLQAASPYDAVELSNRAERRVSNAVRARVSPNDFKPIKNEYPMGALPSVHVGPQIIDPHKVMERPASGGSASMGEKAFNTAGGQGILFDDVAAN
jgi:hypothetical protein